MIGPFFSKTSLISGISGVFSRIWDISAKLRKTARFFDFNIHGWRATINCKLYNKVLTWCAISFHDIERFFPLIIDMRLEPENVIM